MKASSRTVEIRFFASEVMPSVSSEHPADESLIAWVDARPVVWRVVTTKRSRAFGVGSSCHIGWAQTGASSDAVLERARTIRRVLEPDEHAPAREHQVDGESFWQWRARRTLELFDDRGFTGGFFQEHAVWTDDKEYARGCCMIDYTPNSQEEALDRFVRWCDSGALPYPNRTRITVDGRTVRKFELLRENTP